jgi:uncharacterized damage-inducible protein DinB
MLDFVRVYDVHTKARLKLFDWIRPLNQEQYAREFPFAHRTLQATMVELAATELWLTMRLRETPMPRPFRWEQMPINAQLQGTFPRLEAAWLEQTPRTRATLAGITDWDTVVRTELYGKRRKHTLVAAKQDIATQLLLHEVHHRAQAMAMLRHLGVPAADLDYIFFVQDEQEEDLPTS